MRLAAADPDQARARLARLEAAAPATGAAAAAPAVPGDSRAWLTVTLDEPRAFGYRVGDLVTRTVAIHVPDGLALDEASLPRIERRGQALELRELARRTHAAAGGSRHELRLTYQVFLAPEQPRVLEMPSFTLRFQGHPRAQDLRVESWPVAVSPLAPADASPRHGLGELRPDAPAPLIDTGAARLRLAGYGVALAALLAWVAYVRFGLPWRAARQRPFSRAWRTVRQLRPDSPARLRHQAIRQVHEALNRTARHVVFERDLDRFVAAQPRYARVRDELATFFRRSREAFFEAADRPAGTGTPGTPSMPSTPGTPGTPANPVGNGNASITGMASTTGDAADAASPGDTDMVGHTRPAPDTQGTSSDDGRWLVELCRRCRDIERGAA